MKSTSLKHLGQDIGHGALGALSEEISNTFKSALGEGLDYCEICSTSKSDSTYNFTSGVKFPGLVS